MHVSSQRFGLIVTKDEVPSSDVINPSIAVVIDAIPGDFSRIDPRIQIGMR